jgi:hypothetical protein
MCNANGTLLTPVRDSDGTPNYYQFVHDFCSAWDQQYINRTEFQKIYVVNLTKAATPYGHGLWLSAQARLWTAEEHIDPIPGWCTDMAKMTYGECAKAFEHIDNQCDPGAGMAHLGAFNGVCIRYVSLISGWPNAPGAL